MKSFAIPRILVLVLIVASFLIFMDSFISDAEAKPVHVKKVTQNFKVSHKDGSTTYETQVTLEYEFHWHWDWNHKKHNSSGSNSSGSNSSGEPLGPPAPPPPPPPDPSILV